MSTVESSITETIGHLIMISTTMPPRTPHDFTLRRVTSAAFWRRPPRWSCATVPCVRRARAWRPHWTWATRGAAARRGEDPAGGVARPCCAKEYPCSKPWGSNEFYEHRSSMQKHRFVAGVFWYAGFMRTGWKVPGPSIYWYIQIVSRGFLWPNQTGSGIRCLERSCTNSNHKKLVACFLKWKATCQTIPRMTIWAENPNLGTHVRKQPFSWHAVFWLFHVSIVLLRIGCIYDGLIDSRLSISWLMKKWYCHMGLSINRVPPRNGRFPVHGYDWILS